MKVAVANRHWDTAGGGETYALALARSLRGHGHTVTLLGPPGAAWDDLGRRFAVDELTGDEVDFDDEEAFARAAAPFDLLVNAGHATQLANPAPSGILVVHFPRDHGQGLGRLGRALLRGFLRHGRARNKNVVWGPGFYASGEVGRLLRWTDGDGTLVLDPPPEPGTPITLTFGTDRPTPAEVEVSAGGARAATTVVPGERRSVTVTLGDERPARINVVSDTFVPAEVWDGVGDRRPHGVPVVALTVGRSVGGRLLDRVEAWRRTELLAFALSYDAVVCHSRYSARWVRRWWGLDPVVVEPPVTLRHPGPKEPIILAVGRFFAPDRGHSKRQLEMVEAFRNLLRRGVDGWELHLAGGCDPDDAAYLDAVRASAEGLPVHVHVDAPNDVLDDLYARAGLFWHAAGLGVDPEADPEAHEHFGIAVVEAMSAGVVPVVHASGGPAEIVRDAVEGFHFHTVEELVERTRQLVDEPANRTSLARAARTRAQDYTFERFDARVERLVSSP